MNLEGQPDPLAAETDQDATAAVASPAQSTTDVLPATGTVEPDAGAADDDHGEGAGRRRRSRKPPKSTRRVVVEWVVLIAAALVIAFLIKTFLFQAFYIPSESMVPTLNVGDRVLVNKLSYDFHDVHRGDIVVFDAPPLARSNDIKDLVKRVIGLPGETVTYPGDGHLYVNGRQLKESYLAKGTETNQSSNPKVPPGCGTPADGQPGCKVPAGHVFVMGDNRGESKDARFFGPIKESTIVGRVFLRIWPIGDIGFM
ncbi:MAG TPA: signal peptidase I [Acidimicrobiia bacterium]|nr:signal peptidase I [Acidimicrobiia bacterium]